MGLVLKSLLMVVLRVWRRMLLGPRPKQWFRRARRVFWIRWRSKRWILQCQLLSFTRQRTHKTPSRIHFLHFHHLHHLRPANFLHPRTPQLNHGPHFHPTPRHFHPTSRIWRSSPFRGAILTQIAEFSRKRKTGRRLKDCDFSKVRRCPVRWSSESHRQSQSTLRPHQISHPGVTPHLRSPCSEAEEVNAVEMDQRSKGCDMRYNPQFHPRCERVASRREGTQGPWRRGAIDRCRLSRQQLVRLFTSYFSGLCATLSFSDHRGILPSSVKIDATGFSAQLTRSKTLGDDRAVASRPLVINRCCYLAVARWMRLASAERKGRLPTGLPHPGCRRRELSYDTASTMQSRVLRMVKIGDELLFCPSTTRFWTPHSNRTFMPSATATLGFVEKSVRDFLGGWSAQASERYARIAAQRIRNMQRTVVAELQKGSVDPLAEAETLVQVDGFLSDQGVPEEERSRCAKLLERGVGTGVPRAPDELTSEHEEQKSPTAPRLDEVAAQVLEKPEHKGRLGDAFVYDVHRMSLVGKSPKQARASIRAALGPGFYISCSGKKKVRSLHQLGKCYLLCGVDFMNYIFVGNALPKKAEYDNVCRLCARVGVQDNEDSSATVSSSSSSVRAV